MTTPTKDYLVLLETMDDLGVGVGVGSGNEKVRVARELKQSVLDYLKAQGYDIPDKYRLVFRMTRVKRYFLYGKGVPIDDTDGCCDDDTEFLLLRMENGVMNMVTNKKTLLRYRVRLMDREVRTKNSKPLVIHCDTCDHPRQFSMGPCAEGCPCCNLPAPPAPPTEPVPVSSMNE